MNYPLVGMVFELHKAVWYIINITPVHKVFNMSANASFWQRLGLQDWFLKKEATITQEQPEPLTPNDVYKYIVEKFKESIEQLSFGNRVVFYHEFIICFNPADYNAFMNNKKGLFGIIIIESLKEFYNILKRYKNEGRTVEAAANKWVFRFVSNPEYGAGDISYIGKLIPGNIQPKDESLQVTYIPRQTGIAETLDVNAEFMEGFTYYSEGYYEIQYHEELEMDETKVSSGDSGLIARFETFIPDKEYAGKKVEYLMKKNDIIVTGKDDPSAEENLFRIPSDWISSPHLRIRYNKADGRFYLASFGEKTMVNENEIKKSTPDKPAWVDLPSNSKMLLNGIIGINIFKVVL